MQQGWNKLPCEKELFGLTQVDDLWQRFLSFTKVGRMKRKAEKRSKREAESVDLVKKLQRQEADTKQNVGIVRKLFQYISNQKLPNTNTCKQDTSVIETVIPSVCKTEGMFELKSVITV